MKKIISTCALVLSISYAAQCDAALLELNPAFDAITVGQTIDFTIDISGLAAGGGPSLGAFSFDLFYDPTAFNFSGADFGPFLGGPSDSLSIASPSSGSVYLDEVSLLMDYELDALQSDSFTLATVSLTGVMPSFSEVWLENVVLSDAFANDITSTTTMFTNSFAAVDPVPEPATILLFGTGLAGLATGMRKKKALV